MTVKTCKIGKTQLMREIGQTISGAKQQVEKLLNIPVLLKISSGRGKSTLCRAKVTSVFPAVFTVRLDDGTNRTFSYSDVHTKNILFLKDKGV